MVAFLKNRNTGVVFVYDTTYASYEGMVPCNQDGSDVVEVEEAPVVEVPLMQFEDAPVVEAPVETTALDDVDSMLTALDTPAAEEAPRGFAKRGAKKITKKVE